MATPCRLTNRVVQLAHLVVPDGMRPSRAWEAVLHALRDGRELAPEERRLRAEAALQRVMREEANP